jgi:hypothetical protein
MLDRIHLLSGWSLPSDLLNLWKPRHNAKTWGQHGSHKADEAMNLKLQHGSASGTSLRARVFDHSSWSKLSVFSDAMRHRRTTAKHPLNNNPRPQQRACKEACVEE